MRRLFFVLLVALWVTGCEGVTVPTTPSQVSPQPSAIHQPAQTATPAIPRPRVLRINLGVRPDLLDPQRASTNNELAILRLVYEGLTRVDEKGKVLPGAAASWEFSNSGKTLTFHLRDGLVRADGAPILASDFEFAFRYALDPRVGGASPSLLDDVRGALAAYTLDPKSKPEDIEKALSNVGIKATDERTLVVNFDQPTGYWLTLASTWVGYPSERNKVDQDPDAWWIKPENHNGNGPFKIVEIQDSYIRLIPNENYWGDKPKLDRLEFYFQSDADAIESYRRGELEIVRLTMDNWTQAQADSALNKDLLRMPAARVTYIGFNVKKAPFTDKNVRRAFSYALDRDGFVRDVLKGLGKPYTSWIPPGIPGYDASATVPGYDPSAAQRALIDNGYGTADKQKIDCAKLGVIKLSYSNTPRTQVLFSLIAANLTRVFACPVLLDPVEPNAYPVYVRDPKTTPQLFLIPWEGEYLHPQDWLFLQSCKGVYAQRIGYCNKDFDAALAAANQELDAEQALEKYKAAQRIFIGDIAGAFLWNNENAYLVKPYVLGVREHLGALDAAWAGQSGPVNTYAIDTTKVGAAYPTK
ncbi:MAG: peptide ABC transporter substrate-binding protein [Chloroflexi bacterium]|nr:peptide ABC transporter substrate-binding protein [Chloroflexota bacterium]